MLANKYREKEEEEEEEEGGGWSCNTRDGDKISSQLVCVVRFVNTGWSPLTTSLSLSHSGPINTFNPAQVGYD